MAETEYVADGKVQAAIFPEGCTYIWASRMLAETFEEILKYEQEDFKAGKGVKEPCWNCGYNKSGGGICKVSSVGFRENGKEFLIPPKVENAVLT